MLSRADWITYYAGVAQIHAANAQAASSSSFPTSHSVTSCQSWGSSCEREMVSSVRARCSAFR